MVNHIFLVEWPIYSMRVPDCLANPRMQGKLQLFSDPQKQSTLPVPESRVGFQGLRSGTAST